MQWTPDTVLEFIELYRIKDILWNPRNKQYYNKRLKLDAWIEISQQMSCDVSVADLKRKIDSVLGQMRREKSKMRKARSQGQEFVSSWYAYDHLKFLLKRRSRINTDESQQDAKSDNSSTSIELSDNEQSNEETQDVEDPIDIYAEEQPTVEQNAPISQNKVSKTIFKPPPTKRIKVNDSDNRMMNTVFEMIPSTPVATEEVPVSAFAPSNSDDCQMYANFIASKLRTYSQRTKNSLQHEISNLLFQADNGYFEYYQQQSSTPVQSPSASPTETKYSTTQNTSNYADSSASSSKRVNRLSRK